MHNPDPLTILPPSSIPYASVSLEGLPASVKLEIMLKLGDLPLLRRIKLASREYYAVAMIYPIQLSKVYRDQIIARRCYYGEAKPWHTYVRLGKVAEVSVTGWLPEFDVACWKAAHDWLHVTGPGHEQGMPWTMPGQRQFRFHMTDYISVRLYHLKGEHISSEMVFSHIRDLESQFLRRFKIMELLPGDFELSRALVAFSRNSDIAEAAERVEKLR